MLPFSGKISLTNIMNELTFFNPPSKPWSLKNACNGTYATINTNTISHPSGSVPYRMSDFYGYNQNGVAVYDITVYPANESDYNLYYELSMDYIGYQTNTLSSYTNDIFTYYDISPSTELLFTFFVSPDSGSVSINEVMIYDGDGNDISSYLFIDSWTSDTVNGTVTIPPVGYSSPIYFYLTTYTA